VSIWTHIAGVIRVDQLLINTRQLTEEEMIHLVALGAPVGSEDGLAFTASKTQSIDGAGFSLCWGHVSFGGDLRDYGFEDVKLLKTQWLEKIPNRLKVHSAAIRQAIVLVEPEDHDAIMYVYNDPEWIEK